jgi:hypothetical protein
LVCQRLEQVEVAPVDERDLDRHSRKLQRGLKTAEAPADDDYSVWFLFCAHSVSLPIEPTVRKARRYGSQR